jgi:hypothetical protein
MIDHQPNNHNNRGDRYIAMWDMHGLEYLLNLTTIQKQQVWDILSGKEDQRYPSNQIQYWIIRAQTNPQRHYEIYIFDSEIPEEDLLDIFRESPQTIVDNIRQIGHKMFCNRASKNKPAIV